MGKALRPGAGAARIRSRVSAVLILASLAIPIMAGGQLPIGMEAHELGRFTVAAAGHDALLARSLLRSANAMDSFPWLPRPRNRVLVVVAPDREAFRELVGAGAPEYGSAIAFPTQSRVVMQGRRAGSDAGDPIRVLRHELAHLALFEFMGDLSPRWFDEGYASLAAGEWGREQILTTNVALALRGMPSLDALEEAFSGGAAQAGAAYALAHRAVVELAALDPRRGLTLFFDYWQRTRAFEPALRQAFGMTQAAFEKRWRDRTRRRYGALAIFADLTLAALVLLLVLTPFYLSRRRRDRERLLTMARAEEENEKRERESAIEALLRSVAPPPPDAGSGDQLR